jgi:hypothetical protein
MDADKAAKMATVLNVIQQRWGTHALKPASQTFIHLPGVQTGFPTLDALLPAGIPRNQATELLGAPTSGMLTLAFKIIASAQVADKTAIYIDLEETFDPDYVTRCGVSLERLILVRPNTPLAGLDIAKELLLSGQVSVLVIDIGRLPLDTHILRRLIQALTGSGCIVLLLIWLTDKTEAFHRSSPSALRFWVERKAWLRQGQDICGYQSTITILKGHNLQGKQVDIEINVEGIAGGVK